MSRRNSALVSLGILLSRLTGLVRTRVIAHYLGLGAEADVWATAFRIPNFLQNLLGEGALSAAFIPTYARLLQEGREAEARRLAGALLAILALVVSLIVLAGELTAPWLVRLIVSDDWDARQVAMTAAAVRIFFPGAGLMVLSAWCLGVLNSHRRFLLSYASPVVWNAAIVGAIIGFGRHEDAERIVVIAAWGSVVGSLLQVLVQWPMVRKVGGGIVPVRWGGVPELRPVVRAFVPNVISRGANQISAFIDLGIASWLPAGAISAMFNAQVLYTLPVSLFGMAISAAELPEMSRATGDPEQIHRTLRQRLTGATQRLAFYIVPSAVGFITLGGVIAAALLQSRGGRFGAEDSTYVWYILAGSATGLLASTLGRLYASTFYALHDTRTPLHCGIIRVVLTATLGVAAVRLTYDTLGLAPAYCAAALTASAGIAGWIEFALLRRGLRARLGRFDIPNAELARLWTAAIAAGIVGTVIRVTAPAMHPVLLAALAVPANAVTYLVITSWWDIPEAAVINGRLRRLLPGRRG